MGRISPSNTLTHTLTLCHTQSHIHYPTHTYSCTNTHTVPRTSLWSPDRKGLTQSGQRQNSWATSENPSAQVWAWGCAKRLWGACVFTGAVSSSRDGSREKLVPAPIVAESVERHWPGPGEQEAGERGARRAGLTQVARRDSAEQEGQQQGHGHG